MRGRKPKPVAINTPAANLPACPDHLEPAAQTEWVRVVKLMHQMGTLAGTDRAVLAAYCQSWATWVAAEVEIARTGRIVAAPRTKTPMMNPWAHVADKAFQRMLKSAVELGLTPSARTRVKAKPIESDDPMDAYLREQKARFFQPPNQFQKHQQPQ